MNEKQIDDLAEDALNAACLLIQEALGVATGDHAGLYFSDGEVKTKFIEYIHSELSERQSCHE